jgi:cytochrome c oxidase assembly factor CtaG
MVADMTGVERGRPSRKQWYAVAAVVVAVISLLPPVETYARRYVFAESVQFGLFAMVVPALLVLGAPWRLVKASRGEVEASRGGNDTFARQIVTGGGLADRLALSRRRHPGFLRAVVFFAAFAATTVVWRLPATIDALARQPGLAVLEMASLLVAGTGLWLEIAESPPLAPRLPEQQRAVIAALAMWTIWIIAYVLGFSRVSWFGAYQHAAGRTLSAVADQEIATGLLWAVAAACFIPVVYVSLMRWLKDTDDDPDSELRDVSRADQRGTGLKGWAAPAAVSRDARRRS